MNDLGINRITPSMLVEYDNCPLLFYYRSWLGLKIQSSKIHLNFGTAIHAAIDEIYHQQPVWGDPEKRDFNRVTQILSEMFLPIHVDDKDYATEEDRLVRYNEMLTDGILMLSEFWDRKEELWAKGVQPVTMELPVKMPLTDPLDMSELEVPVSCRLDGEALNFDVSEFKTSSARYDEFETRDSKQSKTYVWVQWCRKRIIPVVSYVILIKKLKKNKIQHLRFVYTEADIISHAAWVRSTLEKIRNREFSRPMKNHARYCDCWKYEELLTKQTF